MNIFKKKSLCVALAGVGALGAAGAAQSVNLNPDGLGQVLIYPYYTVRADASGNVYNSLLSVVNTTASAKAVKVRFLEGKNSREVLDFNLFLSHQDVWTVAIVPSGSGGAMIQTTDKSCTLPAIPAAGVAFRNSLLTADQAGAGLDRTTEGYVEIVEMATFASSTDTADNITHVVRDGVRVPFDCGGVSDTSAASDASPVSGGLMGGMTLINVNSGTDYTEDAVALDNFANNRVLYFPTGDTRPDLQQAFPPTSIVVADGGLIFTSNWSGSPNPGVDAVSAVLMHDTVLNEFVLDEVTQSGTDWVVTMPTKRYYVNNGTGAASRLFQSNFNKTVGSCDDVQLDIFDREEDSEIAADFSPATSNSLCWEANVVTFNNSNVLGSANLQNVNTAFENGWLRLSFFPGTVGGFTHSLVNLSTTVIDPSSNPPFVSGSGGNPALDSATYFGLPVVGFAVQSFANGAIQVGGTSVLSNYGGNFIHKGERFVDFSFVPSVP